MMRVEISQLIDGKWNKAIIEEEVVMLEDVVRMCECALRGVGFYFNGNLDIVINDPVLPEDTDWTNRTEPEDIHIDWDIKSPDDFSKAFESIKKEVIKPVAKKVKKPVKKMKKGC